MAEEMKNKFLGYEGVSHLWSQVVKNVNAAVAAEAEIARAAEQAAQTAAEAAQTAANTANTSIGTLANLTTDNKADLVTAINEVRQAIEVGGTGSVVTMDTSITTDGALKSYTIKQGGNTVGTIDIPKDMVVESGSVVVDPEGQTAGTYIKLVLANVAEPLFINVGTLVDLYTATENAAQVQVSVDNSSRKISATIVAGSIGTTELANNAITTSKIADGNVTLDKLSADAKAAFEVAGAAATAEKNAKDYADSLAGNYDAQGSAAAAESNAKAHADSVAGTAESNAKAYADGLVANIVALTNDEIDAAIAAAQN